MRFVHACALVAMIPVSVFAQVTQQPTQTTYPQPPPRSSPQSNASPPDTAQSTAALLHSNGGSLLRASLAAQPDPSLAKASQISFFAVPPPVPKVLKKHDLITIIVREESE